MSALKIKTVLIERDGMEPHEAHEEVLKMRERVINGESIYEILREYDLEYDYLFDLL